MLGMKVEEKEEPNCCYFELDIFIYLCYTDPEHTKNKTAASSAYMNLYFKVKSFYFKYVADLAGYKNSIPEFPSYVLTTSCV
ncbi:unnamed protein product [Enterobius vermicularis]|uniref:Ovule protein n=1 Tax=Enterobius vermicularis TaxID=51028 RepID=A0A0N4VQZ0_ENTVE|nr:unnamed protein product [Enterobius vermicularis]